MNAQQKYFWTDARVKSVLAAIVWGLLIAAAFVWHHDPQQKSMLKRGDFPGFYAPAVIIAEGHGRNLYNVQLQQETENHFWPSLNGEKLVSVYPAFVAVISRPLAAMPPLVAKWFMAALGFFGVVLFSTIGFKPTGKIKFSPGINAALLALFPPMLISIIGGQNTGITLGLIGIVAWTLRKNTVNAQRVAGIALAALLYKPQLGIPLLIPFLLWGEWRSLRICFLSAIFLYALAVPWTGTTWPISWFEAGKNFAPENFLRNGVRMISPLAGIKTIWPDEAAIFYLGIAASGLVYLFALRLIIRSRFSRADNFIEFCAIVAILSPQTLFYDLGLLSPVLLAFGNDKVMWRYFAFSALTLAAFLSLDKIYWPLFSALGLVSLIWMMKRKTETTSGESVEGLNP